MYVIYALIDPRDNTIRYVGQTTDVYKRFQEHLQLSGSNLAKNVWVMELRAANKMVIMETLEEVWSRELALEREAYWIKHFEMLHEPVVNISKTSSPRQSKKMGLRAGRRVNFMQEYAVVQPPISEDSSVVEPVNAMMSSQTQYASVLSRPSSLFTSPEIRKQVIAAWNAGYRSCRTISLALREAGYVLGKDTALKVVEDLKRERLIS